MTRSLPWAFLNFVNCSLIRLQTLLRTCRTSILRGRVPSMSSIASLPSSVLIHKFPCCPFDVLCDLFLRWRSGSPFSNHREYVSILIHLSVRKRVQEVIRAEESRPGDEATETELDLKTWGLGKCWAEERCSRLLSRVDSLLQGQGAESCPDQHRRWRIRGLASVSQQVRAD